MADSILALARDPPKDPAEKKKLYEAARELMFKTEDRHDTTHRVYFSGFQLSLADIATDLGIFTHLAKSQRTSTAQELAAELGCDELLLVRILRGLAAYGLITVDSKGQYGASHATITLADPGIAGCVRHNALTVYPCINALPVFLRNNGLKNPTDAKNGAGQLAFNTGPDVDMFAFLGSQPERLKYAMINMAASKVGQESWIDNPKYFPSDVFKINDDDSGDKILFVDVGSGMGHQAIALRKAHPQLRGRVVIQDLPFTLERVDKEELAKQQIEIKAHDFNTEQPVKHAAVYYLRNILHDWPDDICIHILSQLRGAMGPHSSLVVDEYVVGDPEAHWHQVNYDILMMGCVSGVERTARQWNELFKAAGFAVKEIREYDNVNGDSLIIGTPI